MRDRDGIYGEYFQRRVKSMGFEEVISAPRSPWQNPFVERLIGSIRRECLDHVIVFNERHLLRILRSYCEYYHTSRTHMALDDNAPLPRQVEPPAKGAVLAIPQVGGLHHRYTRRAAEVAAFFVHPPELRTLSVRAELKQGLDSDHFSLPQRDGFQSCNSISTNSRSPQPRRQPNRVFGRDNRRRHNSHFATLRGRPIAALADKVRTIFDTPAA